MSNDLDVSTKLAQPRASVTDDDMIVTRGYIFNKLARVATTGNYNDLINKPVNTSSWSVSNGTNGWARDNATGFTIAWATGSAWSNWRTNYATPNSINTQNIGLPRSFSSIRRIVVEYQKSSGAVQLQGFSTTGSGSSVTVETISQQDQDGTITVTPKVIVFGFS